MSRRRHSRRTAAPTDATAPTRWPPHKETHAIAAAATFVWTGPLGSVATAFGVLSLLVVLAAADLRDISPCSPLALLVDAELRTLSRRSEAAALHFDLVPQDGTSAAVERLVMQPRRMSDALAQSYLVHERAYAATTPTPPCQLPTLADGCTLSLTKPGAEVQIQRQGDVLTVSRFALR